MTVTLNALALRNTVYSYDVIFRELFAFCSEDDTIFSESGFLAIYLLSAKNFGSLQPNKS